MFAEAGQAMEQAVSGDRWHELAHVVSDLVGWKLLLLAGAVGLWVLVKRKLPK